MSRIWRTQAIILFAAISAIAASRCASALAAQNSSTSAQSLDFEFFKNRVEPIFLKRRAGHARCYSCHGADMAGETATAPRYLVKLLPGRTFWTDDQSREIFRNVSRLVDRDDPMNSRLLIHPLSPLAGGDTANLHVGGRQFASKKDPDWQTMAEWVRRRK